MALAHLVQAIGEAARRVSPEAQATHFEIPWRRIIGMRHRIVHDYMSLDEDLLWDVVTTNLDELILLLDPLVSPEI
jgi:uncharacterized protein with HEPN domain